MSDLLYLDLIESAAHDWIKLAFKINTATSENTDENKNVDEKLCLLYTDNINGVDKCLILYIEPEHMPFDKSEINIITKTNFTKTKFLWSALKTKIKHFICSIVKTMNADDIEFFANINIADEPMCMNLAFYPINKERMMNEFKNKYPNTIAIEEVKKSKKDIFQWYVKKLPRLAIKIEILEDVSPPPTHTTLLKNYFKILYK
jgi:hypothetical protein